MATWSICIGLHCACVSRVATGELVYKCPNFKVMEYLVIYAWSTVVTSSVDSDPGWIFNRLIWTTLTVCVPFTISMFTLLFVPLFSTLLPSWPSLPAMGTDIQTRSPALSVDCVEHVVDCWLVACVSTRSWNGLAWTEGGPHWSLVGSRSRVVTVVLWLIQHLFLYYQWPQIHLISVTTPPTVPLMTTAFVLTAATVCDLVVSLFNSSHVAGPLLPARSKSSMFLFCLFTHWPCCRYRIPWTNSDTQYTYVAVNWPSLYRRSSTNVINCSCKM